MIVAQLIKSAVLGLVQGITEWLPISSTGHMIILDEFIGLGQSAAFKEMFLVVIQFGSILAVVYLYWQKLIPFKLKGGAAWKPDTLRLWAKILVACIPAVVVGFFLNDYVDALFYNYQTVSAALVVYGILFIYIERANKGRTFAIGSLAELDFKTAFLIGVFQMLSLVPGTSRSGSTILGAMVLGAARPVAAEFSFFLAVPMMAGASLLKIVKFGLHFTPTEAGVLLVGIVVAFFVSILAIRFLMRFVRRHDFQAFGWYRIVLGLVVFGYFTLLR